MDGDYRSWNLRLPKNFHDVELAVLSFLDYIYSRVPRVVFFMWTAALGWILVMDNLMKRGLPLVNWCCMCQSNGDIVDHSYFIVRLPMLCGGCVLDIWDSLGHARFCYESVVLLEELVWKALLRYS